MTRHSPIEKQPVPGAPDGSRPKEPTAGILQSDTGETAAPKASDDTDSRGSDTGHVDTGHVATDHDDSNRRDTNRRDSEPCVSTPSDLPPQSGDDEMTKSDLGHDLDSALVDHLDDDLDGDLEDDSRLPVEELASEFLERRRLGESVTIEQYEEAHPELATQIREFFPAIIAMENFRDSPSTDVGVPAAIAPGDIPERLGDLRIIRQLGRGGMGVVYEAEQESLHRRVAVKVLPNLGVGDDRRQLRFQREATAAAKLHHTNIVPVLGVGEQDGLHYYVMQLIRGVGLDEIIDRYRLIKSGSSDEASFDRTREVNDDDSNAVERTHDRLSLTDRVLEALQREELHGTASAESKPLEPRDLGHRSRWETSSENAQAAIAAAKIGLQAAEALAYAHEMQVLHRDIKPANLLVDEHGIVWITDFGLAKIVDSEDFSRTGNIVGTLRYMAPERFEGKCDHRSDIHALGTTLYELVAGHPAFDGDDRAQVMHQISRGDLMSLRRIASNVPRDLDTIVLKATATEPENRYQTADELADDLRCFLSDMPIKARRAGLVERTWKWCRRNPAVSSLLAACVALVFSVLGLAIGGYFNSQKLLAKEQSQRQVAEQTNQLAVRTLDAIYQQFAPRRREPIATQSLLDETGEEIEVTAQPVVSDEAARMLESLLPLYGRLSELDGRSDRIYIEKSMRATWRIGDIRRQLGQSDLALEAYQSAVEMMNSLLDDGPADTRLLIEYASLSNEIGITKRTASGRSEWRADHQAVFDILSSIDQDQLDSNPILAEEAAYERTRALYQLGRVGQSLVVPQVSMVREFGMRRFGRPPGGESSGRERGGWPGERERGEFSEFIRDRFRRDENREPTPSRGSNSRGSNSRGSSSRGRGGRSTSDPDRRGPRGRDRGGQISNMMIDSMGDRELIDQAIVEATELVARTPGNEEYTFLLAKCYRERALVQDDPAMAQSDLAEATVRFRTLVDSYPDIADYRFEFARTLATDLRRVAPESAENFSNAIQESVDHTRRLVRQHPNVMSFSQFLGLLYLKQAEEEMHEGRYERVDDMLWSSVDVFLNLFEQSPSVSIHQVGLFNATTLWLTLTDSRLSRMEAGDRSDPRGLNEPGRRPPSDDGTTPANNPGRSRSEPPERPTGRRSDGNVDVATDISRMIQILDAINLGEDRPNRFRDGILFSLYPTLAKAYALDGDEARAGDFQLISSEFRRKRFEQFRADWSRGDGRGRGRGEPRRPESDGRGPENGERSPSQDDE